MLDYETQKELIKETVTSTKALQIAIDMEMRAQNQRHINQNLNNINNQSINLVNNYQKRKRNTNFQQQRQIYNHNANFSDQTRFTNNCRN